MMRLDGDHQREASSKFFSSSLLDVLVEKETRLRIDYRNIPQAPEEEARQFLRGVTAFIECLYVSFVFVEVARGQGCQTIPEAVEQHEDIERLVHALTKLRPAEVFRDNPLAVRRLSKAPPATDDLPKLDRLLLIVSSFVGAFPVRKLVDLAIEVGLQDFGARIQVAHDGLDRFAKRNDPLTDHRIRIVGPDYAAGQLSLGDATHALAMSAPDTVALLEKFGYARPLEHIALTEERRALHYGALRRSRQQRHGKPHAEPSAIARDVIATQRIEDIDARPWLDPKLT
jgi:hypothetical protein